MNKQYKKIWLLRAFPFGYDSMLGFSVLVVCLILRIFVSLEWKRPRYAIIFERGSTKNPAFGGVFLYQSFNDYI